MKDLVDVYVGNELVASQVSHFEAMNWIWSERNTMDHPVHVIDKNGNEIEW